MTNVETLKNLLSKIAVVTMLEDGTKVDLNWAYQQIREDGKPAGDNPEMNRLAARMLLASCPGLTDPREAGHLHAEIARLRNVVYEETDKAISSQKRIVVDGQNLVVDGNVVTTGEVWVLKQQAMSLKQTVLKIAQAGHGLDEALNLALTEYSDHWMTKDVLGFDIKQNF